MTTLQKNNFKSLFFTILILIVINIIGFYYFKRFDLTQDKRYTLSETSLKIIKSVDEPLIVDVFLKGQFPGEFKKLQTETQQVYVDGQEVLLTASEYQLLLQFMQHPNRIYSRDELLVLLNNQRGMHRAIDTHIKNLRRKIELQNRKFDYIRTVHGRGYRFQYQLDD